MGFIGVQGFELWALGLEAFVDKLLLQWWFHALLAVSRAFAKALGLRGLGSSESGF